MTLRTLEPWGIDTVKSVDDLRLLVAAADGNTDELVKLLEQKKVDVNVKDADGNTCLHWVAKTSSGDTEMIQKILKFGASTSVENNKLETALDVARNAGNTKIMRAIKDQLVTEAEKQIGDADQDVAPRDCQETADRTDDLYAATIRGDYAYEYSDQEIETLMTFFCAPVQESMTKEDVNSSVTVFLDLEKRRSVSLLRTQEETFFATSWGKTIKFKITSKFDADRESPDQVTSALMKVKALCKLETSAKLKPSSVKVDSSTESCKEGRRLFASILGEVVRTDKKINYCIKRLSTVQEENDYSDKMSHALLYFVETFALQDTYPIPGVSMKTRTELIAGKKTFFERFYPMHNIKECLTIIECLRTGLLHMPGPRITPQSIQHFVTDNLKIKEFEFISALLDFATCISKNRKDEQKGSVSKESCDVFEKLLEVTQKGPKGLKESFPFTESNPKERVLLWFCKDISKIEEDPHVKSLVFNFLVNAHPNLPNQDRESKALHKLRNIYIHNFMEISQKDVKRDMKPAVCDYYRHQLARKIHEELQIFRGDEQSLKIHKAMDDALKQVGKAYSNFKIFSTRPERTREILPDFLEKTWMDQNRDKVIETYVHYMAPLLDIETETEDSQNHFTGRQKRQLFELFWQSTQGEQPGPCTPARLELLSKLDVPDEDTLLAAANKNFETNRLLQDEVRNLVAGAQNLFKGNRVYKPKLSRHDIVVLYDTFVHDSSFSFAKHKGLLDHCNLTLEEEKIIEKGLESFPNMRHTKRMSYGDGERTVVVSSIVLNILKLMHEVEKEYYLLFDSVPVAFEDGDFISYLVQQEVERKEGKFIVKDPFRMNHLFRVLGSLKYVAPYLASVLIKTGDLDIVDDNSLRTMLETIMRGSSDPSYLEKLISDLKSEKVNKMLADILVHETVNQDKAKQVLKQFCQLNELNGFFEYLHTLLEAKREGSMDGGSRFLTEGVRTLFELANEVVLEAIEDKKTDVAEALLQSFKDAEGTLLGKEKPDQIVVMNRMLLEAKLFNAQGAQFCKDFHGRGYRSCRGEELFKKALKVLNEISEDSDAIEYYLLALSRKAYTCNLLELCTKEKTGNDAAVKHGEELREALWQFVTGSKDAAPNDYLTFHNRAQGSKKYQRLLEQQEFVKYLRVHKVYASIALYSQYAGLEGQLNAGLEGQLKALNIYYELSQMSKQLQQYDQYVYTLLNIGRVYAFLSNGPQNLSCYYTMKALETNLLLHQYSKGKNGIHSNSTQKRLTFLINALSKLRAHRCGCGCNCFEKA